MILMKILITNGVSIMSTMKTNNENNILIKGNGNLLLWP